MLTARAEETDDGRFEGGRGDVPHGTIRVGALLMGVAAGVVAVGLAVGVELAAGVGDHRPAAAPAVRNPFEQMKVLIAAAEPAGHGLQRWADRGVGPFPQVIGDECRVQAGKFMPVHPHAAGVERTGDKAADDVRTKAFLAHVLFGAVALLEDAGAGAEALVVERVGDFRERYETSGHLEDAAQRGCFRQMRVQALQRFVIVVAEGHLPAGPESALRLLVELDPDFLGGVQPLVFRHTHEEVVFQATRGRFVGEVFRGAQQPAAVLLQERPERSPFVGAAQHPLQFEDQDDFDFAGLDLAHERTDARSIHRTARVGRVGEAGDFEPAVGGVFRDEVATDGGLALTGVEASSDLIGGGDAAIDGNGHRAGTAPQRIRLDRRHGKILC